VKLKTLFVAVAIAGAAALVWHFTDSRTEGEPGAASADSKATSATPSNAVVGARPGAALTRSVSAAALPAIAARPSLAAELATARQYKALYDRLQGATEGQTPEGQYILYRILRACATVTDRKQTRGPRPGDERRKEFLAALPETDPNKAKRVAAFEQLAEDKCVGLDGLVTTEAELGKRLVDAAAAGSPNARVFQVEQEMWQERRAQAGEVRRPTGPTLSDTQIESLKTALNSKDPEAMVTAGRILANTFRDLSVRIGPDQTNIEGRALNNAFSLVACDYGYPCGDNNLRVLGACAYQGHCAAGNLQDFIHYYSSTPNDSALQDEYRRILRTAIETGNWSALNFVRGPTPISNSRFMTGPPGR